MKYLFCEYDRQEAETNTSKKLYDRNELEEEARKFYADYVEEWAKDMKDEDPDWEEPKWKVIQHNTKWGKFTYYAVYDKEQIRIPDDVIFPDNVVFFREIEA